MQPPETITFCVHSRNRLYQLKKTLPENLAVIRRHPGIGMTLLNYNSGDGLHEWARSNLRAEIAAGKLTYAKESRSRIFHASKSKNLAHKLAKGRFLINLDADNFIGDTIPLVRQCISDFPRLVLQTWGGDFADGTFGRIGMSRRDFQKLGGYDESFLPVGFQDADLVFRARESGMTFVQVMDKVRALRNPKSQCTKHTGLSSTRITWSEMNSKNMARSKRNLRNGRIVANPAGWGHAELEINFGQRVSL